jgi:Domain of unknown function (DUF3854)
VTSTGPATASSTLLPRHAALLDASAIATEVAAARGYRSVTTRAELRRLGFSERQARVPALLLPVWNVRGEITSYQVRPDEPRVDGRGRAVKYETPVGSRMTVDVPPMCRDRLGDPRAPLLVTEGLRKADAAASAGLCCVALLGVWNWRGTNEQGGKVVLADFEAIALFGREVLIAFDSDAATKREVGAALARLRSFLESRGAHVRVIRLPAAAGGGKTGLDDYLAAGHSVDDLLALAGEDVAVTLRDDGASVPYRTGSDGLVHLRETRDGPVEVRLTNFEATIASDILEDDGAEQRRFFEIVASHGPRQRTCRVAATAFGSMGWAAEQLGAGAVVYPGFGIRDHARAAIQLLSGTPVERRVFTHIGWRTLEGKEVYLHGAGAIGSGGPVAGIEVRLDAPLDRYILPAAVATEETCTSVAASLRLLAAATDTVSFALLGAIYRAPLGEPDFSLHLAGPTGVFKTELAALAQAHYGAAFDARALPGSWSSTPNLNEGLAFLAKDAVLVVDDFAPGGARMDVGRLHRDADRLLRAQGNRAGRGRMRADASLQPPRPPRGLILSTGEDVPRGMSLGARMVVVEVGPTDVSAAELTRCQADAAAGHYAVAMAGYVQWLAAWGAAGRARLRAPVGIELGAIAHRRIARNLQALAAGVAAFLAFAEEVGAVSAAERASLAARCLAAFRTMTRAQTVQQEAADPVLRFLELLGSAIATGRAHVAGADGQTPPEPAGWGWRRDEGIAGGGGAWRPQGSRVGWLESDDLYLEPSGAYQAAQSVGDAIGEGIGLRDRTLRKRLHEAGWLRSSEAERSRLTARRVLAGSRRSVLHLAASALHEPAQPAQPNPTSTVEGEAGLVARVGSFEPAVKTGPPLPRQTARDQRSTSDDGSLGPVGPVPQGMDQAVAEGASLAAGSADEELTLWSA